MKKIICLISAATLFTAAFSGCGRYKPKNTPIIGDGEGAFVIAETEPVTTLPKIKRKRAETEEKTEISSSEEASGSDKKTSGNDASPQQSSIDVSEEKNDSSGNSSESGVVSDSEQSSESTVQTSTAPEEVYYLEGIVYSMNEKNGRIILKDPDIGWVQADFDDKSALKDVKTGDRVLVTHDGEVSETYPAVTKKTYSLEVTEKAPAKCTVQRFECSKSGYELGFSMLVPEGWSSKNIGYPTEGDFTDWGVRFAPDGETKGLDISWHSSFAVPEPYDITPITVNGTEASRYSKSGKWRFYVYNNDYIAANTFYNTSGYDKYAGDIEFMLETLEFEELPFTV